MDSLSARAGDMPLILPPGVTRKIPAGADLGWQMHYTPNGKEAKDKSQVGLVFYKGKEPPKRIAQTRVPPITAL